jgi:hypothetical protein
MTQWQYSITTHQLGELPKDEHETSFRCDQHGQCIVHDAVAEGRIDRMEKLFTEKGKEGWELVQFESHKNELLCVWKRIADRL